MLEEKKNAEEELQEIRNKCNRLEKEVAISYNKNNDLEQIMKEEGENYRRNENDSKET